MRWALKQEQTDRPIDKLSLLKSQLRQGSCEVGREERKHLSTLGRTKLIRDEEQTLSFSYYAASGKQCVLQNSIFLQREHPRTGTKGSGLAEDQARPRAAAAF